MTERCPGCGARFPAGTGPVHDYMISSPGCFAAFTAVLAEEYATEALRNVHRLTVDAWAVQHPGDPGNRRAVQSVGLHLARLGLQLTTSCSPRETNLAMLDFAQHKATLRPLAPPARFTVTVADVAPFAGKPQHQAKVQDWAAATWRDWSAHHDHVRRWLAEHSDYRLGPG